MPVHTEHIQKGYLLFDLISSSSQIEDCYSNSIFPSYQRDILLGVGFEHGKGLRKTSTVKRSTAFDSEQSLSVSSLTPTAITPLPTLPSDPTSITVSLQLRATILALRVEVKNWFREMIDPSSSEQMPRDRQPQLGNDNIKYLETANNCTFGLGISSPCLLLLSKVI